MYRVEVLGRKDKFRVSASTYYRKLAEFKARGDQILQLGIQTIVNKINGECHIFTEVE
jgi:hypothetical protein